MRRALATALGVGLLAALALPAEAQSAITEQEAHAIGVDAYLYFYPLVSLDVTRRVGTNVEAGKVSGFGPPNMFHSFAAFPSAAMSRRMRLRRSERWLRLSGALRPARLCRRLREAYFVAIVTPLLTQHSSAQTSMRSEIPAIGAHRDEVLSSALGLSAGVISELADAGTFGKIRTTGKV